MLLFNKNSDLFIAQDQSYGIEFVLGKLCPLICIIIII